MDEGRPSDEKTFVCRCEDVTLKEIKRLVKAGIREPDEIKKLSRCGMGSCGGKTCRELFVKSVGSLTERGAEELDPPRFRPPTKPLPIKKIRRDDA